MLKEKFVHVTPSTPVSTYKDWPGAMMGSTRQADPGQKAFSIFKRLGAHYFFYIGGNDTAEGHSIINQGKGLEYELRCFHVPKTIDNDLVENDHSPGYGSAAVRGARPAGRRPRRPLAARHQDQHHHGPQGRMAHRGRCAAHGRRTVHLLYFPERAKSLDDLVSDILRVYEKYGRCVAAVSKGISGPDQRDFIPPVRPQGTLAPYAPIIRMLNTLSKIQEDGGAKKDAFGHARLSGTGTLADVIASAVKIACFHRTGKKVGAAPTRSATSSGRSPGRFRRWTRRRRRRWDGRPWTSPCARTWTVRGDLRLLRRRPAHPFRPDRPRGQVAAKNAAFRRSSSTRTATR